MKGAVHRIQNREAAFSCQGFNTNLVHFLSLCHAINSNVYVCSLTCMISHVHRCAPKTVLHAQNLKYEKFYFMKA